MEALSEGVKNLSGRIPVINSSICIRCNACVRVCPAGAILEPFNQTCPKCIKYCISMEVPCTPEKLIIAHDLCTGCGICIEVCPEHAIS